MPSRHGGNGRKRPAESARDARWKEEAEYLDIPVEPRERVEEALEEGEDEEEVEEEWQPPLPPVPPPKRARTARTPPRRPRPGRGPPPRRGPDESATVRFTNIPAEYTYDMVMEMHSSFGLDTAAVEDLDFQPFGRPGRGGPAIRALVVRYNNEETALSARDLLDEQPVLNRAGETLYLRAELLPKGDSRPGPGAVARQWQPRSEEATVQRWEPSPRRKGGKRGSKGPEVIYPSVYLSDVPVEYKEGTVKKLHKACGMDPEKIMAVKFLPAQDRTAETCCCIVRYQDQETADQAVASIKGRPVQLRSGACKFFGAKMAKPARWMVELGLVPAPAENEVKPPEAEKPKTLEEHIPHEADWCGQGPACLGTVGMLLFEDVSTGTPFCEACWEKFEQEDAQAIGDFAKTEDFEQDQ